METIRISVKGSITDAQKALVRRGLRGVLAHTGEHGTFWDVPASSRARLTAWFCEPSVCGDGGFPAGTLLFHG